MGLFEWLGVSKWIPKTRKTKALTQELVPGKDLWADGTTKLRSTKPKQRARHPRRKKRKRLRQLAKRARRVAAIARKA